MHILLLQLSYFKGYVLVPDLQRHYSPNTSDEHRQGQADS